MPRSTCAKAKSSTSNTSTTPSMEHTVTHNLNNMNLIITTWVQQVDGTWDYEVMKHKIIDNNNISVTLTEIGNIKVVIQAVGGA